MKRKYVYVTVKKIKKKINVNLCFCSGWLPIFTYARVIAQHILVAQNNCFVLTSYARCISLNARTTSRKKDATHKLRFMYTLAMNNRLFFFA